MLRAVVSWLAVIFVWVLSCMVGSLVRAFLSGLEGEPDENGQVLPWWKMLGLLCGLGLTWMLHAQARIRRRLLRRCGAVVPVRVAPLDRLLFRSVARSDMHNLSVALARGADANLKLRGTKPLLLAVARRSSEAVRDLLEAGADPNAAFGCGIGSALLFSVERGDVRTARLLVEHGGDVERANGLRETPLMAAARNGDLETLDLLLAAGADAKRRNVYGCNAIDIAVGTGQTAAVAHLLRREAAVPGALRGEVATCAKDTRGAFSKRAGRH